MVSAAAQVQPAQIKQSLSQVSSLAGVCVSFLPQQRVSTWSFYRSCFFCTSSCHSVSCSSNGKGSQEAFLQFLGFLWQWKPRARAPFSALTQGPWLSAAEQHQSPWAQHQAHVNYSKSEIKAWKGWGFIWMLLSFRSNVNLPFLSGKWIW